LIDADAVDVEEDHGREHPAILEPERAAVDLELRRVQLDHVLHLKEQRFVGAHFESFRRVSSWTAIIRFVDSRMRSSSDGWEHALDQAGFAGPTGTPA